MKRIITVFVCACIFMGSAKSQGFDSTQIGKEYPYHLPILGGKAYKKGYKLPLPIGVMANYIYTNQSIVLENFEMFVQRPGTGVPADGDFYDLSEFIVFGPSDVEINTINFRGDVWLLPFFSVGGYYGMYEGQTTVVLEEPLPIKSTTENRGAYWGFNMLAVAPVGPINIAADFSWSWSQNNLLNKPVLVNVAGLRCIKNIPLKKKDMFIGVWAGAQFQFLDAKTEGKIALQDALNPGDNFQQDLDDWYNGLEDWQKAIYGDNIYEGVQELTESTIHYKFDKRLERNWNFVFGGQWQINRRVQFRTELGFIKNKQQVMASLNYRFGIKRK